MGWKEQREAYKKQKRLTEQKTEDLVARRVLRGMGLVQRQLPQAERYYLSTYTPDDPVWDRVLRIWRAALCKNHRARPEGFRVEVYEGDMHHKEALARLDFVEGVEADLEVTPILFMRIRNTTEALAYMPVTPDHLVDFFDPPFRVPAKLGQYWLLVMTVEEFVKQHGPYDRSLASE
jgi:hypothetical protein